MQALLVPRAIDDTVNAPICPRGARDAMLYPNVGERDAKLRQVVAGAGFLFAAKQAREHPVLALAATALAVDLAVTAAARWCWMLEALGLDTRVLDVPKLTGPRPAWGENRLTS